MPQAGSWAGRGEVSVDPHHLAGRAHLGAEHDVDPGELGEREDALFHRRYLGVRSPSIPWSVKTARPSHPRRRLGQVQAGRLGTKGTVREARGLTQGRRHLPP